ncbi:MAG TPA: S41 family peptidase [Exilispira sp.]|nr:S41 family peptidase [Exilispira sp.]
MERKKERLLFIFIISILIIVIINQEISTPRFSSSELSNSSLLYQVEKIINDNYYIQPPENKELMEGAAKGMVAALNDPFSSFVTKKELIERQQSLSHKYGGIGAYITIENNMPMILKLIPDSPAKKYGILPGDIILEVDNKSTKGLDLEQVTSRIKGDAGTIVSLKIQRLGLSEPLIINVKREIIKLTMVKSSQLTKDIFYIKIEDFGDNTANSVKDELVKATKKYKGAVIDLRGNPGGYLSEVIQLLNYFFKDELLVYTKGRNPKFDEKYFATNQKIIPDNFKLVVLVDENTASAAEIFTGVMKDYKRATIIGEKTFGKGVVQQVFQLNDGSAVFLTITQYFTPKGYIIHKNGIEPDIKVQYYQYSDSELITISTLEKKGILYQYIQKYGTTNKEILYKEIKKLLINEKLYLSDTSIRFLVSQLMQYYGEEKLFDLEFDYPLQKAIDQF